MQKIHFSGEPLKSDIKKEPSIGEPFLYILCEKGSKKPFYIGEYGKSKTYNVITRIKRHYGSSANTLARVSNNLEAFGHKRPVGFDAYIKKLPKTYEDTCNRESLEAWVIHIICHELKLQETTFCVVKHIAPRHDLSKIARKIIDEFQRYS